MAGRLEHPRAPHLVVALGVLLGLPTVAAGFFTDDWFMLAALRRRWPGAPAWWDLYDFIATTDDGVRRDVAQGLLPWWAPPSLRIHLVRPLASALLALDHRVFGAAPLGWHLHSLLWWAGLLVVTAALLRRLLPAGTATLALLLFIVVPAHAQDCGWLSARHMVVAALPSMAALLAHVKARQDGWRPGRWLAPLALAVGMAGSEAALGAVAFWVSYEALGPPALGDRRQRMRGAAPALALTALYLVAYRLAGGGIVSSGDYVSPLPDPLLFARTVAMRLPMLVGDALLGVPVELSFGASPWPFVAVGFVAMGVIAALWRATRTLATDEERAALRWLAPGAVLAIAGTCGGMPGGRALLVANLGVVALLAVVIRRGLSRVAAGAGPAAGGAGRRVGAGALAFVHLGLAPVGYFGGIAVAVSMGRQSLAVADALPREVAPARRVFMLTASDPMVSVYAMVTLQAEGATGLDCLARLTASRGDYRVTRLDGRTLALERVDGPMLRGPWEILYRSASLPMQAGDEVTVCGARVRVTAVEAGAPTRLEVRFGVPLDHPDLATVAWDGHKLALVRLEPGETRLLPWMPGPMRTQ